jgi:hypothetical protein
LRSLQRALRRPWGWFFEGCSCERDLRSVVEAAGFDRTEITEHRMRGPFLPAAPQIAGVATKAGRSPVPAFPQAAPRTGGVPG